MKLTAFLLILCLHISAQEHLQKNKVGERNAPFENVFRNVKGQTDSNFLIGINHWKKRWKWRITGIVAAKVICTSTATSGYIYHYDKGRLSLTSCYW